MKFSLFITLFLYFSNCLSEDYILEFQAKVKNSIEYNISKTKKFKNYDLEGTFTDNLGNYGVWDNASILTLQNQNVINLQGYGKSTYQNNQVMYTKGFRKRQEQQAGVGKVEVVNASNFLKPLIGMSCTYAVNFYIDNAYFIQKCKITDEQKKLLTSIEKIKE